MAVLTDKSVFASLKQKGPLAARDEVDLDRRFSPLSRAWVTNLNLDDLFDGLQRFNLRAGPSVLDGSDY